MTITELNQHLARKSVDRFLHQFIRAPGWMVASVYLALITVAEILTTYVSVVVGSGLHIVILVMLILHSASFASGSPISQMLIATMIIPLIRLMSLTMPVILFETFYWYFIISIPLFISAYIVRRLLNLSLRRISFNFSRPGLQLVVVAFGIALGVAEFAILRPRPLLTEYTLLTVALASLSLLIGTGLMEELVFRGILQQASESALGKWGSILFGSLLFMSMHIGWQSLLDLAFVFTAGFFWGYVFYKTRSILGITLSHTLTNLMLFIVLPYLFPTGALAPILAETPAVVESSAPKVSVLSTPTSTVFRVLNLVNEDRLDSSITTAAQQGADPLVIVVIVSICLISLVTFVLIRRRQHRPDHQPASPD